jgi:hypothetical protein
MTRRTYYALNSLGVPDAAPFERVVGSRDDWHTVGVELTGEVDIYGERALYRGAPTASLWKLDRFGDDLAGFLHGSAPVQGYGVIGDQPWYFRARHDSWSLEIAPTLDLNPIESAHWAWSDDYENSSWMEHDVAWASVLKAAAIYRDPLIQALLKPGDLDDPSLRAAYRTTRIWEAMVALAARANGPVEEIRRALWAFGIHPIMDTEDGELLWYVPLPHTREPFTYDRALREAGSPEALDQRICERLREVWPL